MNRRSTDPGYWPAPAVEERLARIETQLEGVCARIDGIGRTFRWAVGLAVAAGAGLIPLIALVVR